MGVTYIVYCSGHFSKKAAKTFLRPTVVIPFVIALGPKENQQNDKHYNQPSTTNFTQIASIPGRKEGRPGIHCSHLRQNYQGNRKL